MRCRFVPAQGEPFYADSTMMDVVRLEGRLYRRTQVTGDRASGDGQIDIEYHELTDAQRAIPPDEESEPGGEG